MHTVDRAQRRAALDLVILTTEFVGTVLVQRDAWIATLLRAPVHETVFTDIKISASGSAMPAVWLSIGEVSLKAIVVGEVERRFADRHDLFEDRALTIVERLQLPAVIVNEAHRGRQPQLAGPMGD